MSLAERYAALPLPYRHLLRTALLSALLWTLALAGSLYWLLSDQKARPLELARAEARSHLGKDQAFRRWASAIGGFYGVEGALVSPNPVMGHLPDRDIKDQFGRQLTLINPATALREIGEGYADLFGVRTRITSNIFLDPHNAPDAWEAQALARLQAGGPALDEIEEVTTQAGEPVLRVMRPMWMEADCLKCHAVTGIKVGELRGGTDVTVPLRPYLVTLEADARKLTNAYAAIWSLGLLLLVLSVRRSWRHEGERLRAEASLRQFSAAVHQSASAVMICESSGAITYVNPRFSAITGYSAEEALGRSPSLLRSEETPPEVYREMWLALRGGEDWRGEFKNRHKSGEVFWCQESLSCIKNEAGITTHYLAIFDDVSERRETEETIRHLAHYDALTGLPNRRLFQERLKQAMAWARRSGEGVALLYLDLDRFKAINDSLGHHAGDALLKEVAQRVSGRLRQGDTVARLGGDEFAVILVGLAQGRDAETVAEAILMQLTLPVVVDCFSLHTSVSIGISAFPEDSDAADELVRYADIALYKAKAAGRNCYRFYAGGDNAEAMNRLQLENDLRAALSRNELFLVYQPKIWLNDLPATHGGRSEATAITARIPGVEALLRWQHPERGMVSPADFIPLAEETGLIVDIGDWVIAQACAQLVAWDEQGLTGLAVAVNVSALQLRREHFAGLVLAHLERAGLRSGRLELEVTESSLLDQPEMAKKNLETLRNHGVSVAIDDFGTGYSSLGQLQQLPADVLKIDQCFVRDFVDDTRDHAIAAAIITLGRGMGLTVVAEGVETTAQLMALKALQCDQAQGYLFSRPLPGPALASWLREAAGLPAPVAPVVP